MKNIQIASVAYLALAALSSFAGEQDVVTEFKSLSPGQQEGLIAGVDLLIANPEAGADARHNAWMEKMLAYGWVRGGKKMDEEKKTHPRLCPFGELPKKEQAKEQLLLAIVRELGAIEVTPGVSATAQVAAKQGIAGSVPIKYIGNRDEHKDNLYGTGLEFAPGQVHSVSAAVAAKMLAHTDVYEQSGDATQGAAATTQDSEPTKLPVPLVNLDGMNSVELVNFAQQHYGEHFAADMPEEAMRSKILGYIQARGR